MGVTKIFYISYISYSNDKGNGNPYFRITKNVFTEYILLLKSDPKCFLTVVVVTSRSCCNGFGQGGHHRGSCFYDAISR